MCFVISGVRRGKAMVGVKLYRVVVANILEDLEALVLVWAAQWCMAGPIAVHDQLAT